MRAFDRRDKLGTGAIAALTSEDDFFVCPASFYEITFKASLGKWPAMVGRAPDVARLITAAGIESTRLDAAIFIHAGDRDWSHHDPFDRIIASTAELLDLILITRDAAFATLPGLRTVW